MFVISFAPCAPSSPDLIRASSAYLSDTILESRVTPGNDGFKRAAPFATNGGIRA